MLGEVFERLKEVEEAIGQCNEQIRILQEQVIQLEAQKEVFLGIIELFTQKEENDEPLL